MSQNTQWDSLDYQVLDFPYNRINSALDPEQRIFRGQNAYVTKGGTLAKRPGTINLDGNNGITGRIDRLWQYETLEPTPNVYLIASVFTGTYWQLFTKHMTSPVVPWTMVTSYRDVNASTRAHEGAASHGYFYVKAFPASSSSEKLGSVLLDGEGGTIAVKPWGLLGPQTPAALSGANAALTADITSTDVTINVTTDTDFPATPFVIQIEYEQMLVTAGLPGTAWTVTRGYNGTAAAAHVAGSFVLYRDWTASDHLIDVSYGWTYTYAYKTITGQVSNRAPLQTNPDLMPSFTGAFFDLIPKIVVQGIADTTNIPTICIYRTTDGGGTFYKLEEIPNTGPGDITYLDDSLESGTGGGVYNDPLPDSSLDTFDLAPSLFSNSPPPTVLSPEVVGVDTPMACTPIVSYQSRLWYAIGNVLFFSAEEELNEGIPEESWPSGAQNGRNGNFYRFQYPIVNLSETTDGIFVFTLQSIYKVTGNNLETFSPSPAFENYGAPPNHPRAVARFGETVAFMSHDYRVALISNDQIAFISDPLWTDLVDQLNQNAEFDIKYFGDLDKEWLVVSSHRKTATEASRQWVYDLKKSRELRKDFWFPPWTVRSVASLSARASDTSSQRRLIWAVYDEDTTSCGLVRLDPTARTGTDWFLTSAAPMTFNVEFHQMLVPAGNHVNQLRVPGATPKVYGVSMDRIMFPNDEDPLTYWYYDDLWTDPDQSIRVENPPRRRLSKGFKTLAYTINEACQHFSARITKLNTTDCFELVRFTVIWDPDSGT